MDYTSFDGTRIAYSDEGSGRPVLLLHGYMFDAYSMYGPWSDGVARFFDRVASVLEQTGVKAQIPRPSPETERGLMARLLDAGARVIAPDMRGHGASDKPTDPRAYRDFAMARDAVALLDHLELQEVEVMGYSMGSINALRLLALGEERIRSVILGGMGTGQSLQGHVMADWGTVDRLPPGLLPEPRTWAAWTAYAAAVMMGEQAPFGLAGSQLHVAAAIGMDRAVAAAVIGSLGDGVAPEILKAVKVPVLVLNGDDDLAKIDERGFAGVLSDVRFGSARGDHISALFDPDFQREVIAFLQSRWTTGES